MDFLRNVLRVYSWIFEAVLCAMAIAVAGVTIISGNQDLKIGWLPWPAETLTTWMIALGFLGLLFVLLAVAGKLRVLLFLFAIYVVYLLAKGFFINLSYTFPGPDQARNAAILLAGAVLAMIGAWPAAIGRRR